MTVYGLGIAAAGLYSCDAGCPSRDLSSGAMVHQVVSIIAFVAGILGIALWAFAFRPLAAWRPLWRYSAISSAVALVLLLVLDASKESRALTGVWQRLCIATLDLWCAVVGLRAFRSRAAPRAFDAPGTASGREP
jgi:hypothetical protein